MVGDIINGTGTGKNVAVGIFALGHKLKSKKLNRSGTSILHPGQEVTIELLPADKATAVLIQRVSPRPKLEEFSFHVYLRWLHPELFEVVASRHVERGGYCGRVQLTTSGHVITWQYREFVVTEVACPRNQPLPLRGKYADYWLRGARSEEFTPQPGVSYRFSFQVEPIRWEVLQAFQEEFLSAGEYQGMLCQFDKPGQGGIPALSYAYLESRNRSMLVQVFHTFPEEWMIVKVESVFQILSIDKVNGHSGRRIPPV